MLMILQIAIPVIQEQHSSRASRMPCGHIIDTVTNLGFR